MKLSRQSWYSPWIRTRNIRTASFSQAEHLKPASPIISEPLGRSGRCCSDVCGRIGEHAADDLYRVLVFFQPLKILRARVRDTGEVAVLKKVGHLDDSRKVMGCRPKNKELIGFFRSSCQYVNRFHDFFREAFRPKIVEGHCGEYYVPVEPPVSICGATCVCF